MWIRQSFVHALGPTVSGSMSSGFIYEHPNIKSLAKHMLQLVGTQPSEAEALTSDAELFLARYTRDFPTHIADANAVVNGGSEGDVVLVTGTTGALGSALLATLVASKSIAKVYALNRPSKQGESVAERQEKGLASRGYDPGVAKSPKVVLVEGDSTKTGLKVDAEVLEEVSLRFRDGCQILLKCSFSPSFLQIRRSVTHIIHNGAPSVTPRRRRPC